MKNTTLTKLQYEELKNIIKDFCVSSLGKTMVDKLMPSSNVKTVKNRLIETSEGKTLLESSTVPLQGIVNIDNIIINVEKDVILSPEALRNVSDFLRGCRKIKVYMKDKEFYAPTLMSYSYSIKELENIEEEINKSINNNIIDSSATKELKRIRRLIENTEIKIEDKLEGFLKSSVNKILIQDFFITKRNGRFTIPIKSSYKNQVDGTLIDSSSTGSTVFIEPAIVSKFTSELMKLKEDESNEEYQILSYLTGLVREYINEIKTNVEVIGLYDMIFAKAKYSISIGGISPDINDYGYIKIINGRHPLLKGKVVPLNFSVGKDYRTLIITGPNAGGKTVVLKAVGLLTLAVQSGFHIPCEKGSIISVFENIFADIGDDQSIENALSTFSSHIKNIAEIINETNKSTLLLFDEIGSGTEPNEGAALAISILEEVYHRGAITIATTHYGEIKNFSLNHNDFENAAMLFNSETLEPLYKLSIGQSGKSNALWISKKMGINKDVVQRAENYIKNKDYNYNFVSNNKIRSEQSNSENIPFENYNYEIGDKVYLTEYKESGLIYKPKNKFNNVTVLYDNKFIEINVRQIKLEFKAAELYPEGYDLDSLFTSFAERKLEKDIIRGSKKALKKLQKMRKERQ
ncbi:dsDNA-specific endonuclease/ATPase MutS2 [Sedimentibacter acidaminivorans]|uniref:DsDNA-specific endonuclease/ATPase MutS2 n=1 Tax=Sedimentibacter acidaminivorans TaxID=913099 RepID=A0ABS4GD48_9FIRM|nr:endonuclease MutS2 [Sedimentibacter acidaminivorans]MBP1925320.1 dsDNA-specific endonuclease/ATPase MutS2 [Sedimentibacter acidaminivorans]